MTPSHREPSSIGDYALIGDSRTAALISRDASIAWLCLPEFSGASVFGAILDPAVGGSFSLRPTGRFQVRRHYVDHTPVLQTDFETAQGRIRLTDFMTVLDGVHPMRPLRELVRIVEGLDGEVDILAELDPRPDYGCAKPRVENRGVLGWFLSWQNDVAVLRSNLPFVQNGHALAAKATIAAGARLFISFSYTRDDPAVFPLLGEHAQARLERTLAWWRQWGERCTYRGPYRDAVQRSAMVLQLLSHSLSGSIVAAPTTSLPEAIGAGRNWDYRYCWLRDAGLTVQALVGLGYVDEARAFVSWLLHATRLTWPELRVMYDVYGGTHLPERQLEHLTGFGGSAPVRIGNDAARQTQLDVYGEIVIAADTVAAAGVPLDAVEGRMLKGFGKSVCKRWRERDNGIWEIRSAPRHYTLSKAMCWAALDRLLKMQQRGLLKLGPWEEHLRRQRDTIREIIEARGFNPKLGSYTSALDGEDLDASLLLLPCIGYLDAGHPRMRGTFECVWNTLADNGLLHRYRPHFDGMDSREGAFGACCYWAVENLAKQRNWERAEGLFEHLLGYANDVGLFGEEIDIRSGAALGNFPQAFTHVGLINAALAIETARKAH